MSEKRGKMAHSFGQIIDILVFYGEEKIDIIEVRGYSRDFCRYKFDKRIKQRQYKDRI